MYTYFIKRILDFIIALIAFIIANPIFVFLNVFLTISNRGSAFFLK